MRSKNEEDTLNKGNQYLLFEKISRMCLSVLVSVSMARVYGPSQYGDFMFAMSVVLLLSTVAGLGIDNYMVQVLSSQKKNLMQELTSLILLRLFACCIALVLGLCVFFYFSWDKPIIVLCLILSLNMIIAVLSPFQALLKSMENFSVVARIQFYALVLSTFFKGWVLFVQWDIKYIAWGIVFDSAIIFILCFIEIIKTKKYQIRLSIDVGRIRTHLKHAIFLLIGALSAIVYMRMDQIMVGEMLGSTALGYYGVAVRMIDGWIPLLVIFVSTTLPGLTREFDINHDMYMEKKLVLNARVLKMCFVIGIGYVLFGEKILVMLFGDAYVTGAPLVGVLVWSLPFVLLSHISWSYTMQHNLYFFSCIRLLLGALCNLILNYMFIASHGLMGCVFATLISYALSSFLINALHKKTRALFIIQSRAIAELFSVASWRRDLHWIKHD